MAALDKKGSFKKMRKEDFYFDLPEELIAQDPASCVPGDYRLSAGRGLSCYQ